jgi:hypothetical protein
VVISSSICTQPPKQAEAVVNGASLISINFHPESDRIITVHSDLSVSQYRWNRDYQYTFIIKLEKSQR